MVSSKLEGIISHLSLRPHNLALAAAIIGIGLTSVSCAPPIEARIEPNGNKQGIEATITPEPEIYVQEPTPTYTPSVTATPRPTATPSPTATPVPDPFGLRAKKDDRFNAKTFETFNLQGAVDYFFDNLVRPYIADNAPVLKIYKDYETFTNAKQRGIDPRKQVPVVFMTDKAKFRKIAADVGAELEGHTTAYGVNRNNRDGVVTEYTIYVLYGGIYGDIVSLVCDESAKAYSIILNKNVASGSTTGYAGTFIPHTSVIPFTLACFDTLGEVGYDMHKIAKTPFNEFDFTRKLRGIFALKRGVLDEFTVASWFAAQDLGYEDPLSRMADEGLPARLSVPQQMELFHYTNSKTADYFRQRIKNGELPDFETVQKILLSRLRPEHPRHSFDH
ncbi:hypothetical protein HYV82_02785 [Candidatus Woesearchaeota archaeon]|nr:hypothetical protein [Candidatus Woesearchaeota archaeon]